MSKQRTPAQRERQADRHRDGGRYAKVNPCQRCGKSAGVDFCSYRFTDCVDPFGNHWGDEALVVCDSCCVYMESVSPAVAWSEAKSTDWGKLPQGKVSI